MTTVIIRGACVAGLILSLGSCGKDNTSPSPSPAPESTTTIVVSATGANPQNIVVPRGSQVTFVNSDGIVHEMYSDPHPEHTDCPEFDSVGHLSPGQRRQTGNLIDARTCKFHDHLDPFNNALKGSVVIQ